MTKRHKVIMLSTNKASKVQELKDSVGEEKLYTIEEVVKLLNDCWNNSSKVAQKYNMGTQIIFDEWIKENLK